LEHIFFIATGIVPSRPTRIVGDELRCGRPTNTQHVSNKLNQFNGDYISAEMVKAFISSTEYRQRFGS